MEQLPKLLTLKETADILNVNPNTLRPWDKHNLLRTIRTGING